MRLRLLFVTLCMATAVSCRSAKPETIDDSELPPLEPEESVESTPSEAEIQEAMAQEGFEQDAERFQRRSQRRVVLSMEYLARGDAALDRADYDSALTAYASALEVDPGNRAALEGMARVEALMGDRYAVAADTLQDATDRMILRRAQARIEAERAAVLGDAALQTGDYGAAIERYRQAELILRYHPLIASDSLDERIVSGKLETAIQLKTDAQLAERMRNQEQAARQAAELERRQREYFENKLVTLYEEANGAFRAENYARAESLTRQILLEDPGNEAATYLFKTAREARHDKTNRRNRQDYREQWQLTFDGLSTMAVPQNSSIVFDDLERWRLVMQRQPVAFSSLSTGDEGDKQAVLDRLSAVTFTPNFGTDDGEGAPLEEVAAFLQSLTGVNFVISSKVREDLDEDETAISLILNERSVRKVLDILSDTKESLRWKIEDGVVKFVTVEEMIGGQVLSMYEVRDLIQPIPDFPASEINVSPSGGIVLPEEDFEERESNVVTADALETLIRNTIMPESWDADPQNTISITELGTLIVNQTPEGHEMIRQMLDDLREATGIMVDIQARFMKVEDNFLEDIGVDFRGLGDPGLGTNEFFNDFGDPATQGDLGREIGTGTDLGAFYDDGADGDLRGRVENLYDLSLGGEDSLEASGGLSFQWTYLNDLQLELILRAVSKSERIELVTAPRVLVYNTSRANLTVLNQVAYVQDFDVEIAQAASIADPIVNVVQDGVILDVRPVVSADRRFITLELRPTVAELQRPIREVVTTLGSQNSVTIQLPELDIQRVRTAIPIPDGGTVLLGGMKVSDSSDFNSGVPILNKLPIFSFVFGRQGNFVSNRKLLILLKAKIVIPEEHEPTPAQMGM